MQGRVWKAAFHSHYFKLKMDQLEKFIHKNRPAFDSEIPNLKVWANIDRQLGRQSKPRVVWMRRVRAAAAIAVLLVAACAIGFKMGSDSVEAKSLADVSPEYAEMEDYFKEQVNEKMAQLVSYKQDDFVRVDIQEMDSVYEELKLELEKAPAGSEQQVIQAMISNYQTKIDILEQVLEKVETTEQTNLKTEENEVSI